MQLRDLPTQPQHRRAQVEHAAANCDRSNVIGNAIDEGTGEVGAE